MVIQTMPLSKLALTIGEKHFKKFKMHQKSDIHSKCVHSTMQQFKEIHKVFEIYLSVAIYRARKVK